MRTLIGILAFALGGLAQASTLVCEGQVDFYGELQNFKVTIEGQGIGQGYKPSQVTKIEVSGASLESPNVFTDAKDYWDGHASGMITARGFAMTYDNSFGCIRNVIIATDFRGSVKDAGMTVGHITQSQVIALCKNESQFCSK